MLDNRSHPPARRAPRHLDRRVRHPRSPSTPVRSLATSTSRAWLAEYWPDSHADGDIYPQGSFASARCVAPVSPRATSTTSTSYAGATSSRVDHQGGAQAPTSGSALARYVATGPDGEPKLTEGKRCWTLDYPRRAVPHGRAARDARHRGLPNGILLTDRELCAGSPRTPSTSPTGSAAGWRASSSMLREAGAWPSGWTSRRSPPGRSRRRCSAPCRRSSAIATCTSSTRPEQPPGLDHHHHARRAGLHAAGSLFEVLSTSSGACRLHRGPRREPLGPEPGTARRRTSPTAGGTIPAAPSASSTGSSRPSTTSRPRRGRGLDRIVDEARRELRRGPAQRGRRAVRG